MNPTRIRDGIAFNSSLAKLKVPAFQIIAAAQDNPDRSAVIEAQALTLALVCQTLNLDVHELVARARRQIEDANAVRNPHFEAIRDFAAGELK